MLIYIQCHINLLVPQPLLNIFERSIILQKNCCMGVTETVVIKISDVQIIVNNAGGMLHRPRSNIRAILPNAYKADFLLCLFLDYLSLFSLIITNVSVPKVLSCIVLFLFFFGEQTI